MANHYHLQVETSRANLSRAIQWLNVGYSIWFTRKYKRVGPLFQGGMQYPAVTMAIRRLGKGLETNKALARKVKRVEKMLLMLVKT
jgi:hypothetical protein